jgi:hypothetical protein
MVICPISFANRALIQLINSTIDIFNRVRYVTGHICDPVFLHVRYRYTGTNLVYRKALFPKKEPIPHIMNCHGDCSIQDEEATMMNYESDNENYAHDQQEGLQYYCPILFEGGMDIEECEMYYRQVDVQQNGGTIPSREVLRRIVPRDTISLTQTETTSILRKSRYTKPKETNTRPSFVRRFSFSNHKIQDYETQPAWCSLRRSNSMRRINCPRVKFNENVHVVTINAIDDIPHDIQQNLWMSADELLICMHEAAIAKLEEEIMREQQQLLEEEGEEEEQFKEGMAERRNSNTSVIDDDESFIVQECKMNHNQTYFVIPPVA